MSELLQQTQTEKTNQQTLITLFYLCQKWGDEQVDLTYEEACDVYCEVAEAMETHVIGN